MNVLSLFDGMSCGRLALDRAGIVVDKYYRSEIDKWANKVAEENYPDSISLGNVENYGDWDIDWGSIDLVIGGSPCQGFSFAGTRLAFDDPRSKLFFTFAEIVRKVLQSNPRAKFLLENVNMKQQHLDVITETLGVQPEFIDSKHFSPALRQRQYWFNWDMGDFIHSGGGEFQDVLDSGLAMREKAFALTSSYYKKGAEPTRQRAWKTSQRPIAWMSTTETRWLSPVECERLMTVPERYTACVSDTQRYRMLGNGWTINVITHIFRNLSVDF